MTGGTMTERVMIAVSRVRDDGKRWRMLIDEWRECIERFGPDSGAAKGALLGLVREAWSDSEAYAAPHHERIRWLVWIDPDSWPEEHEHPEGDTEEAALVDALEAAPTP